MKKDVLENFLRRFIQNQRYRDMINFTISDREPDDDPLIIDYENVFLRLHINEIMNILENRNLGLESNYFRNNAEKCNQLIIETLNIFKTEIEGIFELLIEEFYNKNQIQPRV